MKNFLFISLLIGVLLMPFNSVAAQPDSKGVSSDFLYGSIYFPSDTVIFYEEDSLVIGEITLLESSAKGEYQIQMQVGYGDKTAHYFIFVNQGQLRVAQEKTFKYGVATPMQNIIYFPLGKGKIRMLNYNTSVELTTVEKSEQFKMIVAYVEEKLKMKIKY